MGQLINKFRRNFFNESIGIENIFFEELEDNLPIVLYLELEEELNNEFFNELNRELLIETDRTIKRKL